MVRKERVFNSGTPGHLSKDCRKKKKTDCFHCDEAGHLIKDFPKKGQRAGSTSGGQVQALMAPGQAKGQVQAIAAPPLQERGRTIFVESLVFLFDHPVRTLFDSGASHSFISASLVELLHLNTSLVEDPLVVSNPIGGSAYLSMMCLDLKISILSVEFRCDAFVLGFTGYGLILGMNWLSSNGVVLIVERE